MNDIPIEVREHIRTIFKNANDEASRTISEQPAIHEESLDHILISAMNKASSRILRNSGAALAIDTHWLGGRRLYLGRWEIADIALVAVLRHQGRLVWRKIALFQSKRLYPREINVVELEESDYVFGIGRLIDIPNSTVPLFQQRAFSFDGKSKYQELRPNSDQVRHIETYQKNRQLPVYYSLYHPLDVPHEGNFPLTGEAQIDLDNNVGCRVARSSEVHGILRKLETSPTYDQLNESAGTFSPIGWRLEQFVADELLTCREGRRIEEAEHPDLNALLYERTAPISAAIVITIDLPSKYIDDIR